MKTIHKLAKAALSAALVFISLTSMTMHNKKATAYLEITLDIKPENRADATAVYLKYKEPFLTQIEGAVSKELLLRSDDVQVLHGFENENQAKAYLSATLFEADIVGELKPFLESGPEVRIYSVFTK